MQKKYPYHDVIKDIGSGVNLKRKGLRSLLQRVFKNSVTEIVVASSDRLTRFNFEFFEWLFLQFGCNLICLNKPNFSSTEPEFAEDILSLLTVFMNGKKKIHNNEK